MNLYVFEIKSNPSYETLYGITCATNRADALEQIKESMATKSEKIKAKGLEFSYQQFWPTLPNIEDICDQNIKTAILPTQDAVRKHFRHAAQKRIKTMKRKIRKTKMHGRKLRCKLFLAKIHSSFLKLRIAFNKRIVQLLDEETL